MTLEYRARYMAAYACDNADPDTDPELVAKFLAHLRQVEADTEKKYADMALHYERMRARLEGEQSIHVPTEAEYRAFLAASPSVDPAINGYRWLCENIKPKPQAERGMHIPPEAMQGWSQEEMAKHRNMAMGQQSKPEPCVSLPNDDEMYRQARIYSSYDPEKDDKESFYYKIQCAFIDGFHRCRANVKLQEREEQCVEWPSEERVWNACDYVIRPLAFQAAVDWLVPWLRANVKMRTVDDVRAEANCFVGEQESRLSKSGINTEKLTKCPRQDLYSTIAFWVETANQHKAKAQVLVDALEEIDLRTPSDGTITLPIAIKIAREALKIWRGE